VDMNIPAVAGEFLTVERLNVSDELSEVRWK
jgi:hypothetical protein